VGRDKTFKGGPAKILARIYAIARHLIGHANQKTIQSLTPIQRAELYEAVMDEAISSRNLETIQYHLRSFNTWLEKHFLLSPLPNKADFFGAPKLTDMTVNANLIHFDEYEHLKKTVNELCHKEPHNKTFTMMRLSLFLGFRCGMRSKEVFQLKLDDFIFCDCAPQIAIRESIGREIKTLNAKRFLKLRKLMPEDEVQYLKDWYFSQTNIASHAPNQNEDENSECFFFSTAQTLDKPVVIDKIKSPLMNMVREVCQDDSLNFHHLRHSFASWHFLSACNAELDLNIENEFNQLPATQNWLMKAQQRKLEHLPTHLKSKKYAFWLLKNMGHGGFSTTFEHYIHIADIVVSALLNQKEQSFTINEISEFSGVSISTLKKQQDRVNYIVARSMKPYQSLKVLREASLKEDYIWQPPEIDLTNIRPIIRDLPIYKMMAAYHLSSESEVSGNDSIFDYLRFDKSVIESIREIFKLKPKYRIRRLQPKEEVELQYLIHKFEDVYSVSVESFEPTTELYSIINTFMNRFYPMNSDRESLSVQKHLHLVMSDRTSATTLVNFIQRLELPFQLILRHSKKWSKKEVNQTIQQWRKELNLKSEIKFEHKIDNQKKIGPRARVEILVQNSKGKKNQAFYYLMIMLSAWLELTQKIA
jgi:integrase